MITKKFRLLQKTVIFFKTWWKIFAESRISCSRSKSTLYRSSFVSKLSRVFCV